MTTMKWQTITITGLLTLTLGACASVPLKIPVEGNAAALAGRWDGEFTSDDGTRTGSIVFDLRAGKDTAFGDVFLIARAWRNSVRPSEPGAGDRTQPAVIAIRFVRVDGPIVRGTMARYHDPETGYEMRTVFDGTLKDNVISGRYQTINLDTHAEHTGHWIVRRSGMYADTRVDGHHAVGKAK